MSRCITCALFSLASQRYFSASTPLYCLWSISPHEGKPSTGPYVSPSAEVEQRHGDGPICRACRAMRTALNSEGRHPPVFQNSPSSLPRKRGSSNTKGCSFFTPKNSKPAASSINLWWAAGGKTRTQRLSPATIPFCPPYPLSTSR